MQSLFVNSQRKNLFISISYTLILWGLVDIQASRAETPSAEEMWETILQQQKLIEELKARLDETDQRVTMNEVKVEEATEEVEAAAEAFETAQTSKRGSSWTDRTTIGGYGELHYNNREGDDEVDFHRFVLYFGHEFTDNIRFFSELELEHALAGEGKSGEVELEQAWIEMDLNEHHRLRAGLDILPIGLINFTHEPNTYYGVERNKVETEIIPTTWWEAGLGLNGEIAPGWNYDVVLHSGLSAEDSIRGGREKVSKANADHPAITTRLRYTGIPGLEVGGSFQYQSDITAGAAGNSATLFEGHIDWKHRTGFGLRVLYSRWDLDDVLTVVEDDDTQYGYYIEPAYRFPLSFLPGEAGVFTRWSELDYGNTKEEERIGFGINYWPVDQVAFKFDWFNVDDIDADTSTNSFNLGIGYQF